MTKTRAKARKQVVLAVRTLYEAVVMVAAEEAGCSVQWLRCEALTSEKLIEMGRILLQEFEDSVRKNPLLHPSGKN